MESNSVCDQNRTTAQRESDLLITSMITDRIGRHEVLLPINHKNYKLVIFLGLRFTFDARANLSLVQIKVIYDYYSSKRIIPFFIGEEELLSTIFELSRNAL